MTSQAFPGATFQAELCVMNDEDYATAHDLCEAWRHPPDEAKTAWTCPKCGETVEGQFSSCWKCGTEAASSPKA